MRWATNAIPSDANHSPTRRAACLLGRASPSGALGPTPRAAWPGAGECSRSMCPAAVGRLCFGPKWGRTPRLAGSSVASNAPSSSPTLQGRWSARSYLTGSAAPNSNVFRASIFSFITEAKSPSSGVLAQGSKTTLRTPSPASFALMSDDGLPSQIIHLAGCERRSVVNSCHMASEGISSGSQWTLRPLIRYRRAKYW